MNATHSPHPLVSTTPDGRHPMTWTTSRDELECMELEVECLAGARAAFLAGDHQEAVRLVHDAAHWAEWHTSGGWQA